MLLKYFLNLSPVLNLAVICTAVLLIPLPGLAKDESPESNQAGFASEIYWQPIDSGISLAKISFIPKGAFLRAELYVLRFNLREISLVLAHAPSDAGIPRTSVKELVQLKKGIAGINASFFDKKGAPLGLLLPSPSSVNSKLHTGGSLLTGVFQVKDGVPSIVHRTKFAPYNVSFAIQAGPRLFSNKEGLEISVSNQTSRRSGIAVTENNEVLIFATLLRFPGSSLEDIQLTLEKTGLPIQDALNFDGGGSSQLFIKGNNTTFPDDIFISGGDDVPTALVLKLNK